MFENKNVLITGGTGMIGRQLVDLLLNLDANITVVAIDTKPQNWPTSVKYISADLRNFNDCLNVCDNQNYVFHLAGIKASPKMTKESPASIMVPMLQFNTNMMQAAHNCNVDWYLYTSSVGVYHPAEILREEDVWSTHPSDNDFHGGWAKRIGELQADAFNIQYKKNNISIVRPANVYGPYDNFNPENAMVIPSLIRKGYENSILKVWGNGTQIRDFIHAKDVARGMIHAVTNHITEPLNLGSGTGHTIKEVSEIISQYFDIPIKWDIKKPTGDKKRILDMNKAKKWGFSSNIDLNNGIISTCDWFKKNIKNIDARFNAFKA